MEPKVEVKIDQVGDNLTIRTLTGLAREERHPLNTEIVGNIDTVERFLSKRVSELNQKECHILVDREAMIIRIIANETSPDKVALLEGKLVLTNDWKRFKINTGESWDTFSLADHIKMNRSFFDSKEIAAALVIKLRDFKAKIEREVENFKDEKANYTAKRKQVVDSNLPDKFSINVRVFKGAEVVPVEVEINIHPDTLNCILISPSANDMIREYTDKALDEQIKKIEEIAPDIAIIEQ